MPNFSEYELCARCLHQCMVCQCLVASNYQCFICNRYSCYAHTNIKRDSCTCHDCDAPKDKTCFTCSTPISRGYEYQYWYCGSCAPWCIKCRKIATSNQTLCSQHELQSRYPTRSIFHPSINTPHVPVLMTILLALRRQMPRPIVMMIIEYTFN